MTKGFWILLIGLAVASIVFGISLSRVNSDSQARARREQEARNQALCQRINTVDSSMQHFIEVLSQNSQRNAEATATSPTASLTQKVAATRNLAAIAAAKAEVAVDFPIIKNCS